jgi:hypothetical protein
LGDRAQLRGGDICRAQHDLLRDPIEFDERKRGSQRLLWRDQKSPPAPLCGPTTRDGTMQRLAKSDRPVPTVNKSLRQISRRSKTLAE